MSLLTVRHVTTYRYSEPLGLGQHRTMFRPRESHDLKLRTEQEGERSAGNLHTPLEGVGN